MRENLAVTFSVEGFDSSDGWSVGPGFVSTGSTGGVALPVGVHWNPFKGEHRLQSLKPFLAVGVGLVAGSQLGTFIANQSVSTGETTRVTIGGHFGAGLDVHAARSFSLGLEVGYNAMANFSEPVGGHKNLDGVQMSLGIGWLFGKGYAAP